MKWAQIRQTDLPDLWIVSQVYDYEPKLDPAIWDICPDLTEAGWVRDAGVYREGANADDYADLTDEALRADAYGLNQTLADEQILAAEGNPVVGTILDERATKKENKKRNNRAKGKDKVTGHDDVLSDHIDDIMDVLDNADDDVESMSRAGLIDYDGSGIVWPVWTPPL